MVSAPTLTDGVVTLRAHREDDVDAVVEQSTDPSSIRWTRVPVPYTRDDAKRFVREAMPAGWTTDREWAFAVEARDATGTPRYAGTVSLRNEGTGRAEIAYGAHPWARGRGVVDAALRLLLEWGFSPVASGGRGLETVVWWAEEGNWASRKAAWRLGFSCDGTLRQWLDQRDGLTDTWVGTLGRDDVRAPRHAWLSAPYVAGERVALRPMRAEDLPRVFEACTDERTSYWLGRIPQPFGRAEAARFLAERQDAMARGEVVHWAIAHPVTDLLLGSTAIFDLNGPSGPEVGFWAHPDARGKGLITEAIGLVVRHAFIGTSDGGLGLGKVRLVAAAGNTASRAVAERLGFRLAGVERAGTICRDGRHDAAIYDLLAGEGSNSLPHG